MGTPSSREPVWLKRVLIPFWIIRMLFEVVLICIYLFILAALGSQVQSAYGGGSIGILVGYLLVLLLVVALDVAAIIKFVRHRLRPLSFLIFNVIQSAIWFVILGLELRGALDASSEGAQRSNYIGPAIAVIVLISFLALLAYASVVYHRHRMMIRRGTYAPAHNPSNPSIPLYNQHSYQPQQPTVVPYAPPTQNVPDISEQAAQHQTYAPFADQTQVAFAEQPPPAYPADATKDPSVNIVDLGSGK